MTGDTGSAVVEYAGLVAVLACLFAGLVMLRPVDAGRRAPVRPLPAIIRMLQAPARPVLPAAPVRVRAPRPRRPRPRPPTTTVMLPVWLGGGNP